MIDLIFTQEELDKEEWKAIPSYEELYEVSSLGRVKRKRDDSFLKICYDKKKYHKVKLKTKSISVHQLVAMAFLNHIPCGMERVIDHINEIKTDNRVENLQILSNRDNTVKSRKLKRDLIGVTYIKSQNKWRANIQLNKINYYLGLFNTSEEANNCYEETLKKYITLGTIPTSKIFSSIYKGVDFHKVKGKWQARVQKDKIRTTLGLFDTEIEAFNEINKYKNLNK